MRSDGMLFRLDSLSNIKLYSGYKLHYNHVQSESIFRVWLPVSDCFAISFCFVPCFTTAPASFISMLKLRYEQLCYSILLIFNAWIFIKLLHSEGVICLQQ